VEEFDDFLSLNVLNKLGWNSANSNGWQNSEQRNRFPGTLGVFTIGVLGINQAGSNYSHLRLGNLPVKPLASEGYVNIEYSGVVGLANFQQTNYGYSSRFGLLDTGAGEGTVSSVLISAEFFGGAYNWVAIWKSVAGPANRQVISPVIGDLGVKVFQLKIQIDCVNFSIRFSVDDTVLELVVGGSNWLFGAMSPIFVIQRHTNLGDTQDRAFYIDKFLMRKNFTEELPSTDVDWNEVVNKPDFDLLYRQLTVPIDWSEIANAPPALSNEWAGILNKPTTATRWPTWNEVSDKPLTSPATTTEGVVVVSPGWSGEIRCFKTGSTVIVQGEMHRGAGFNTNCPITLPVGYRPSSIVQFVALYVVNVTLIPQLCLARPAGSVCFFLTLPPAGSLIFSLTINFSFGI
jgi:hypothetical protein